jgi:hypothetical protein
MSKEDKRSEWNFEIREGKWMWTVTHPDGSKMTAPRRFYTVEDCIEDAELYGYALSSPEA